MPVVTYYVKGLGHGFVAASAEDTLTAQRLLLDKTIEYFAGQLIN